MKAIKATILIFTVLLSVKHLASPQTVFANQEPNVGGPQSLERHLDQSDIDNKTIKFKKLIEMGEIIFAERWTKADGQGRPAATGATAPTKRDPLRDAIFIRTSGPDATSCADCHNQPTVGGAGGFVSNVFVLAQNLDPVTDSVSSGFSNERNTLGMNGAGAIEMLAREMTNDLLHIRGMAQSEAVLSGKDVTRQLITKGISFGSITAYANGQTDISKIEGVDSDLIIKPFHQKGVVNSLRVFTINAYNHHHGMEAVERFGIGQKDSKGNEITTSDFDEDGVKDELTVGDITSVVLFQASMNTPGRVVSDNPLRRAAAQRGEAKFSEIGCADCHRPILMLNGSMFKEPNPYNPPGNLRTLDVTHPYVFDLTRDTQKPCLERTEKGGAIVRAFTDLKRHVICDDQDPFFCNEKVIQSGVATNQFLTRKLWDAGNTAPYGHRGDLTTIAEAVLRHAGEARPQRERFAALNKQEQDEIVEFLKQLRILPNGSPREITESELRRLVKSQKVIDSAILYR